MTLESTQTRMTLESTKTRMTPESTPTRMTLESMCFWMCLKVLLTQQVSPYVNNKDNITKL